ncbi:hypothetical protein VB780_03180 [Leptolyngbya sp. CCNP1308]|uniref:hypothetical protein n=1 Tax=Leptolyngbya sp. CCNP1308 TaxID=3110255 RepID=UPI002B1F0EB0|nr:hypothetical protein [Leptolyngbya sp. CCNP1308]MEA5447557.1 hypothetical protein [Leptolyngbya sp. CCNP1308]
MESNVQQSGKYGINLGEGQGDIHIGDRIYQIDQETLRSIIRDELWTNEYSREAEIVKTLLREELRLFQKEYGTTVGLGLNALSDLLHNPEIRDSVITFRADFRTAREKIAIVAKLKELHDLLHNVEVVCYEPLAKEAKQFPEDEIAVGDCAVYHMRLQNYTVKIQAVCQQIDHSVSTAQWPSDLQSAEKSLGEAIAALDPQRLRHAIYQLKRIIASQPSRLNTQLNQAARALRLSKLIESMFVIQQKLFDLCPESDKVRDFELSIAALADLANRLAVLVVSHDYWQAIDIDLRLIETTIGYSFMELEVAWPDLKARVKPFFDEHQDDWTTWFQSHTQNLESAMREDNPARIRSCFHLYRSQALNRFYRVDTNLKLLFDELSKVGEHLAGVLNALS